MTADNYWQRFYLNPQTAMLNLFYYFFGRFTGMLLYFPVAFFLTSSFFPEKNSGRLVSPGGDRRVHPGSCASRARQLLRRQRVPRQPLFSECVPPVFFLGYRRRLHSLNLVPVFLVVLFLAPVFLDSHQYSAFPRLAGMNFPLNLFPPEKTQFASLPSNENPRGSTGASATDSGFFLNDNFNNLEGDFFWTYGNKRLELFSVPGEDPGAPGRVDGQPGRGPDLVRGGTAEEAGGSRSHGNRTHPLYRHPRLAVFLAATSTT